MEAVSASVDCHPEADRQWFTLGSRPAVSISVSGKRTFSRRSLGTRVRPPKWLLARRKTVSAIQTSAKRSFPTLAASMLGCPVSCIAQPKADQQLSASYRHLVESVSVIADQAGAPCLRRHSFHIRGIGPIGICTRTQTSGPIAFDPCLLIVTGEEHRR